MRSTLLLSALLAALLLVCTSARSLEQQQPHVFLELGELLDGGERVGPLRWRKDFVDETKGVTLKYDVEAASEVHNLHVLPLSGASCDEALSLLSLTYHSAAARASAAPIAPSHFVAGRSACLSGSEEEQVLLHRVVAVQQEEGAAHMVHLTLEPVQLQDVFRNAQVSFKVDRLPGRHFAPEEEAALHRAASSSDEEKLTLYQQKFKRGLGHWLKKQWGSIKHWADDLGNKASGLWHDIKEIGRLISVDETKTFSKDLINWNWNASTQKAKGTMNFGAGVSCTNCYALLQVGLTLEVAISDLRLTKMQAYAYGTSKIGVGASATLSGKAQFTKDLGTVHVPRISFTLGPVPVTIDTTIPVQAIVDADVSLSTKVGGEISASGTVKMGVQYNPSSKSLEPLHSESYTHTGSLSSLASGKADFTIGIDPVVVFNIDYIGGPAFASHVFAEFVADVGGCSSGKTQVTLNVGVQSALLAEVKIKMVGHQLVDKKWGPQGVLSYKKTMKTMCLSHFENEEGQAVVDSEPLLRGNAWFGTQKLIDDSNRCDALYPHSVTLSLQLTEMLDETHASFVLAGNAVDDLQLGRGGNDRDAALGFCLFQSSMNGTFSQDLSTLRLDVNGGDTDADYYSCSDVRFPIKAGFANFTLQDDGFTLLGNDPSGCLQTRLELPRNTMQALQSVRA